MTFSIDKLIRDLKAIIEENEATVKLRIASLESVQQANILLDKQSAEAAYVLSRLERPREPEPRKVAPAPETQCGCPSCVCSQW